MRTYSSNKWSITLNTDCFLCVRVISNQNRKNYIHNINNEFKISIFVCKIIAELYKKKGVEVS